MILSSDRTLTNPAPGIFSRANTGIGSVASSVTTAPSRTSIASFESEDGQPRRRYSKSEQSIETQAKQMKYLKIEFSDDAGNEPLPLLSTNQKWLTRYIRSNKVQTSIQ